MGHNLVTQFSRLTVHKGQRIRRDDHNVLVKLAQSLTIQRGAVKGRQTPDGWTPRIQVTQSVEIDCPWQGSIAQNKSSWLFTFTTGGFLAGIVPTINGTPIDQPDANGNLPQLEFDASAFAQYGNSMRALLLLKVTFDPASGYAQTVEPIAVPAMPQIAGTASGLAYACLGFLTSPGSSSGSIGAVSYQQMRFFNIGWASPAWFWADS